MNGFEEWRVKVDKKSERQVVVMNAASLQLLNVIRCHHREKGPTIDFDRYKLYFQLKESAQG